MGTPLTNGTRPGTWSSATRDLAEQLRKPHNAVATALNLLLSEQKVQRAPLRRVLEIERVSAGYLCREIPENSVKGNGGNENCHRKNCCESDFNALMVRPFAEQIHIYSHGLKRKRPTPARAMGRFRLISPPPKLLNPNLTSLPSFVNSSCVPNGGTAGLSGTGRISRASSGDHRH